MGRLLALERLRVHRVLHAVRARDADERLDRHRVVRADRLHRDVAGAHVHHPRRDEFPQALVERGEFEQRRQRARVAIAEVLLRDLQRIHVLALGAAEVADRVAAVRGLLQERQLLQVEQAVRAAAHGECAVEEFRGEGVLVLGGEDRAEPGDRHDQAARGDALRRFEELERLLVARLGAGIVAELVLGRAEVVVGDRQLVVALGIGLGQLHHALGVGQRLVEARLLVEIAELGVGFHARVLREDPQLLLRRGLLGRHLRPGRFRQRGGRLGLGLRRRRDRHRHRRGRRGRLRLRLRRNRGGLLADVAIGRGGGEQ